MEPRHSRNLTSITFACPYLFGRSVGGDNFRKKHLPARRARTLYVRLAQLLDPLNRLSIAHALLSKLLSRGEERRGSSFGIMHAPIFFSKRQLSHVPFSSQCFDGNTLSIEYDRSRPQMVISTIAPQYREFEIHSYRSFKVNLYSVFQNYGVRGCSRAAHGTGRVGAAQRKRENYNPS